MPHRRGPLGLDIHPSAGKVVLAALIILVGWLAAIAVTDWIRYDRVDTWSGPDATVRSGLRLAGCPDIVFREDVYFPAWVRFEGEVFRWTDRGAPIGQNSVGRSFLETGYTRGDLELFRVANSPDGRAGRQIMIRQGESPVGAIYVVTDCA